MPQLQVEDLARPTQQPRANARAAGMGVAAATSRLGEAFAATSRVVDAVADTRAQRRAMEFQTQLSGLSAAVYDDPGVPIEEKLRRFDEGRDQLMSQYGSGGLFSTDVFEMNARFAADQIRVGLEGRIRDRLIEENKTDQNVLLRSAMNDVALARDPEDIGISIQNGLGMVEQWVAQGTMSEADSMEVKRNFLEGAQDARLIRYMNESPAEGIAYLQSNYVGEERPRQEWLRRMRAEQARRESAELSQGGYSREDELRGVRAAHAELIDIWTDRGITEADVDARRDRLAGDPALLERMYEIARSGGSPNVPRSDLDTVVRMEEELRLMTDFSSDAIQEKRDEIERLHTFGALTFSDAKRLTDMIDDPVLDKPLASLRDMIVGDAVDDPARKLKYKSASDEYVKIYNERLRAGQPMTLDEANDTVKALVRTATLASDARSFRTRQIPKSLRAHVDPNDPTSPIDPGATSIILDNARLAGELSDAEKHVYERLLEDIIRLRETAQ